MRKLVNRLKNLNHFDDWVQEIFVNSVDKCKIIKFLIPYHSTVLVNYREKHFRSSIKETTKKGDFFFLCEIISYFNK